MAYKVIILYQLYMPSYFLGTFTEYPSLIPVFYTLIISPPGKAGFILIFYISKPQASMLLSALYDGHPKGV